MSVVAPPMLDLPSRSVSADLPPLPPHPVPFPVFHHRHTSPPYAMPHSFSVLGAPETSSPASAQHPPPAPKPPALPLPGHPADAPLPSLPPTPEPSPPSGKGVLFPDAMVKLAPPDEPEPLRIDITLCEEALEVMVKEEPPARPPLQPVSLEVGSGGPGPSSIARAHSDGKHKVTSPRHRGMGPPRPRRAHTTHPHSTAPTPTPTSVRMSETHSADSRARLRASFGLPRSGSYNPYNPHPGPNPSLSRALTDVGVTPPRGAADRGAAPDLGGPDGLEAKVVLLGSQGVGKTSLILRYTTRAFDPTPHAATIGSSLHTRKLVHDGVRVKLQIWDTAGQERFRSMAPIYYRGAHVCVLVYDTTDRQSFEDVRSWLDELGRTVPKDTVMFVAGAKTDRPDRQVTLEEASRAIRLWLKPAAPPAPPAPPPASKTPFRQSSRPDSLSPTPRSSHTAESVRPTTTPTPIVPTPKAPTPTETPVDTNVNASRSPTFPGLKIVPSSPRQISFPQLQSPSLPTSSTTTDHGRPSITPASPSSRHGVSGGRFSISGVLGLNRTTSMSGAISSLAQLAEQHPAAQGSHAHPHTATGAGNIGIRHPSAGAVTLLDKTPRVRVESSPLLGGGVGGGGGGRRRSEDWSSRSWRMGEGPSAAEALGEFGAGVKKKESGEMLGVPSTASSISSSSGYKKPSPSGAVSRSRAGSLGRDSRLYGQSHGLGGMGGSDTPRGSELYGPGSGSDADDSWGIDVEGIRLGECSALSGQGVERLFRAISHILVERKGEIERERTLRHKRSVMLTDPAKDEGAAQGGKGRYACCV